MARQYVAICGSGSRHALQQAEVACPMSWTLNQKSYARVILWLDGVVIRVWVLAWCSAWWIAHTTGVLPEWRACGMMLRLVRDHHHRGVELHRRTCDGRSTLGHKFQSARAIDCGRLVSSYQMPRQTSLELAVRVFSLNPNRACSPAVLPHVTFAGWRQSV
jgi:hypothetical protein